jgi:hypothetical protein
VAIKQAIKEGKEVLGARLIINQNLQIKWKKFFIFTSLEP